MNNLTKVYVVLRGDDYEGSQIVSIFSTFDGAKKCGQCELDSYMSYVIVVEGDDYITWRRENEYITVRRYKLDEYLCD